MRGRRGRGRGWVRQAACASEQVHDRVVEQTVAFPVLSVKEEHVRIAEQIVDFLFTEKSVGVLVPQMRHDIVEVIQPLPVERIKGRVADQMVDMLVPPVVEEFMAAVQVEQRIDEQLVEAPVLFFFFFEEIAEVVRLAPQARVQRIDAQSVQVPMVQTVFENCGGSAVAGHQPGRRHARGGCAVAVR